MEAAISAPRPMTASHTTLRLVAGQFQINSETHWAQSRGRLQWTRNSADPHPYYDSLVSADSSSIRACWNQERQGEPRPQPRMTTLALKLHREDEVVGIGHCFEIITTAPWSAKLSTFAWRLVAGVLPVGKATGRKMAPEFDALDDTCMLCDSQGAGDTIEHVFGCCGTLQPLRDWVKRALDVTAGWAPPWGHGELLLRTLSRSYLAGYRATH